MAGTDPACADAHGKARTEAHAEANADGRALVAVFDSPVARHLLHFATEVGFRTALVEPDPARLADPTGQEDGGTAHSAVHPALLGPDVDVVVTDHHRPELGEVLRDVLLGGPTRWVGVMGNPRHPAPHVAALAALGVPEDAVTRVHRPIGLNIGSRTPAEIAIATLAGLIADRNHRPGGFHFG
ncbi:MAG TPA: XdhC family protein [Pseudonocardiaceae bacterium]|jgi:xanthine/CO dehydrogenase XdhC/CoxF family maturation factor